MAKRDKNTLYSWAIPKWKPLAVQIKDWFDSYWHKDDGIPIISVTGLQDVLNNLPDSNTIQLLAESINGVQVDFNADGSFEIPPRKILDKILVKPTAGISLKIGTATGLDDIAPQQDVEVAGVLFQLNLYAVYGRVIYLSGITSFTSIKFYLRPGI